MFGSIFQVSHIKPRTVATHFFASSAFLRPRSVAFDRCTELYNSMRCSSYSVSQERKLFSKSEKVCNILIHSINLEVCELWLRVAQAPEFKRCNAWNLRSPSVDSKHSQDAGENIPQSPRNSARCWAATRCQRVRSRKPFQFSLSRRQCEVRIHCLH